MSDGAGAAGAITLGGETKTPDLLVEGNAELFVRNTGGSEEAPPPALPAGPRPVDENAALPADYPARGISSSSNILTWSNDDVML